MLQQSQPAGDGKQEGCRPAEQDQPVARLDCAKQPPVALEHDVPVAQGREGHGRKIERRFEVTHGTDRPESGPIQPDLDRMDGHQPQDHEQDDAERDEAAFVGPDAVRPIAQHPQEAEQAAEMDGDGEADHEGREREVGKHALSGIPQMNPWKSHGRKLVTV